MKVPFVTLVKDPNFPGLMVCEDRGCKDQFDPYRLPARKTERINLRFPRPDVSVAVNPDAITTGGPNYYELSPEQNTANPPQNGNLNNLSPSP